MTPSLIIHHWLIDHASGSLIHQITGEQRRLGEYQLKLLQVLAEHAGETLTREELTNLVWERRIIGNNSLPNAIHALRLALEDDGKQQRIIKTVPKKGYILEAEFCQSVPLADVLPQVQAAEDTVREAVAIEPGAGDDAPALVEAPAQPAIPLSPPPPVREARFWRWLVPGQIVLLAALLAVIAHHYFTASPTRLQEKNSVAYSNIRLVEVRRGWVGSSAADDLNKQLGPVLFALNQYLENRQVKMEVFFLTSGAALSYTMTFTNQCNRRQLAMNIINWRTDGAQLSALIYREGERKINEMANCVNNSAGDNAAAGADGNAAQAAAVRQ
ncbi:transcriptional regulator [Erwinia sp. JUb26]|uniref:winged helix-turn-helix domain-containing protein n=1 Tax=Erwinia sp. JUb26 TaxID=2485126 RepID=UPI000F466B5C|nr:transcriptional regulator [Erwinia sp. JUb26]ROR13402.1 DNA-binding winged helix-turn-helix (wHTH) protein [Erwinia sp. JUb26]